MPCALNIHRYLYIYSRIIKNFKEFINFYKNCNTYNTPFSLNNGIMLSI